MKVAVILILIGVIGTVTQGLIQKLEDLERRGWVETIQTTALLGSARILKWVLEIWGDLLSQTPVKDHQLTLIWKSLN